MDFSNRQCQTRQEVHYRLRYVPVYPWKSSGQDIRHYKIRCFRERHRQAVRSRKIQGPVSEPHRFVPYFHHVIEYEGALSFSDAEVFVIDPKNGHALPLSPLYYWGLARSNNAEPDLYELDTSKGDDFLFRAIQIGDELRVSGSGEFSEIHGQLRLMKEKDQSIQLIEGLTFSSNETS